MLELIGILSSYGFFKLKQRIFEHDDIQNNFLTPDKEPNILISGTPFYVIMQEL